MSQRIPLAWLQLKHEKMKLFVAVAGVMVSVVLMWMQLGLMKASLGGLDRLVFTAGIGANAAAIRAMVCTGMEYLGIRLDHKRIGSGDRCISASVSQVTVEAFATDEEMMIAGHVRDVLEVLLRATQPGHAE